jgi:hypothetical protein
MVHRLELAAVNRNDRFGEQVQTLAQHDELTADAADRFAVVFTEPRNGLEVRCQAAREPHQFDVALGLAFKATAGLNTVQVAVDVDLEHHLGVIRRPTGQRWFDAFKPKLMKIKLIDKDINYAHGICVRHVVIKCFGEEKALRATVALNEPLHRAQPPRSDEEF